MAIPLKRTASSPPSKDGKKHKDEDCVVCNAPATENVMECVWCEARLHAKCAKISDEQCILIGNASRNVVFLCTSCLEVLPEAFRSYDIYSLVDSRVSSVEKAISEAHTSTFQGLKAELATLQSITSNLATKVKDLYIQSKTLQEQLQAASCDLTNKSTSSPSVLEAAPSTSESSASTFLTVAKELDDRERRKNNVIVYNLPETSTSEDEKWFSDLCKTVFDLGVKITKVLRLGKPSEDRIRPLLIVLDDLNQKEFIVSHSHYLRRHPQYKNIYVSTDMTKFQRQKHKKLVQELKKRRERGERNLMILNGEIVLRRYRKPTIGSNTPSNASNAQPTANNDVSNAPPVVEENSS